MSSFGYSKMARNAISAMSYLATLHSDESARANSAEIAQARDLPQTLVAKVLTTLSQAGYVTGAPGPRGGYRLAKDPKSIRFHDVVSFFDPVEDSFPCPFGVNYCPNDNPCPLHDDLVVMRESVDRFLKDTNFGKFVTEPKD